MSRAFNPRPRNRLISLEEFLQNRQGWEQKGHDVQYKGSQYHKRNPGLWGLPWPSPPRPLASKCEDLSFIAKIADSEELRSSQHEVLAELKNNIEHLLQQAFRQGTFSIGEERGWPSCLWVITEDGEIAEAQRGVRGTGEYHGYPFKGPKELEDDIRQRWERNHDAS